MDKFKIYSRKDGFYNSEFLNPIGLDLFNILKELKEFHNKYFHRINSISITSLERSNSINSAHYYNLACDFIIDPIEYMPYFFGVIHAVRPYNIYLGFDNDLHIHLDSWEDNPTLEAAQQTNRKGIETNAGVKAITGINLDAVLSKYGFSWLESIQDFGLLKEKTRKLLLTYIKKDSKLPISYFCEFPKIETTNWLLSIALIGATLYLIKKDK